MAAISLTNSTIYAQNINNFAGELFKVGGQRTPFLSAVGGLNGGNAIQSTFWQVQIADNAKVSSEPTKGQEGAAPTEYLGRDRAAYTFGTQVFHKGVQMTYTALASYQNQNPFDLSANIANSSDGDGTVTAADKLGLYGAGSPIVDEFALQMELALEKVAREVEWFAFNGTFADGANTTPGSGTREMRGLYEYLQLNKNASNTAVPVDNGGNAYYNDTDGDDTGTRQKMTWDTVAGAMKRMYDASAPMINPVLVVTPGQLLSLNKELVSSTSPSTALNGAILPRDRNVGGIDIDTIVTPFGSIGLMVIDPNIMPNSKGAAFILDLAFIKPVFTNIPGYGTVFIRDIDQDANARVGKAVYMEMGLDFGPPNYHCVIHNVTQE